MKHTYVRFSRGFSHAASVASRSGEPDGRVGSRDFSTAPRKLSRTQPLSAGGKLSFSGVSSRSRVHNPFFCVRYCFVKAPFSPLLISTVRRAAGRAEGRFAELFPLTAPHLTRRPYKSNRKSRLLPIRSAAVYREVENGARRDSRAELSRAIARPQLVMSYG